MASGRVPTRQQSRAWCADSQGRAGSTVRRPPAARTTRELLDWELQAQGRQPTWGARVRRLRKAQSLASPIPHPDFCSSLSPTSDTTNQASNCLRCCSLPVSIEKAGGEQGGPGSTSPCRVSKSSNCTLCCSSLYSYRPRYDS